MPHISFDTQSTPSAFPSTTLTIYADSTSHQPTTGNDAGKALTLPRLRNWSTADQVIPSALDTYLVGSSVGVPRHHLQVGTSFRWRFFMTKNALGTGSTTWTLRAGLNGTTSDSAKALFLTPAQTAATDTGAVEIVAVVRTTGAS